MAASRESHPAIPAPRPVERSKPASRWWATKIFACGSWRIRRQPYGGRFSPFYLHNSLLTKWSTKIVREFYTYICSCKHIGGITKNFSKNSKRERNTVRLWHTPILKAGGPRSFLQLTAK
jgi:hypothetical protein